MTESQKFLLALVRMALWGREEPLAEYKPNWHEVLLLAEAQTLLGLVAQAVPMLPENLRPDPQSRIKLHSLAMKIICSHSLLDRKVADIKSRMDSYGMHTVLLKGQGTALNYPNPLSRQCGDIDMYVGEENFPQTLRLLNPSSDKDAKEYRHLKHFNIEEDGVDIEIHRIADIIPGFKRDRLFQQWTKANLEGESVRKVEIGGTSVNLPSADFDALYIMNHAWHHFMNGGVGLRQLCDWTMHLHRFHNELDVDALRSNLHDFGLARAWQILASVAVRYLGLPQNECPLYNDAYASKAEKVLDVIWSEGNFGHYSSAKKRPRPKGYFSGKLHSFRGKTSRITRIISISPVDVLYSWAFYSINGILNVFQRCCGVFLSGRKNDKL